MEKHGRLMITYRHIVLYEKTPGDQCVRILRGRNSYLKILFRKYEMLDIDTGIVQCTHQHLYLHTIASFRMKELP